MSDKGTYMRDRKELDLERIAEVHQGRLQALQSLDESVAGTIAALEEQAAVAIPAAQDVGPVADDLRRLCKVTLGVDVFGHDADAPAQDGGGSAEHHSGVGKVVRRVAQHYQRHHERCH